MAVTFDHNDMTSWYFSGLSRVAATQMLRSERESGVFLVRDSNTIQGDFVLCVRETDDGRVSHYIINRVAQTDGTFQFRIGDQQFADLPSLLAFYRLHYLDSTPLVRPLVFSAPTAVLETVIAKYDFDGQDTDDLPFRKGEVLDVICKDEDQWWTARNRVGNTGSIPVPYVMRFVETSANSNSLTDSPNQTTQQNNMNHSSVGHDNQHPPAITTHARTNMQRLLPAQARVRQTRVPNAYDRTALRLELGDIINVTKININGQWEGELNGRTGHFPFTHVEFLDELPPQEGRGS